MVATTLADLVADPYAKKKYLVILKPYDVSGASELTLIILVRDLSPSQPIHRQTQYSSRDWLSRFHSRDRCLHRSGLGVSRCLVLANWF